MTPSQENLEQRLRRPVAVPTESWEGLRARFVERAAQEGLVDVAYARIDAVLTELAARVSPRLFQSPGRLDRARRELEEYFDGTRTRFDLELDWALIDGFGRGVLDATARIPYGQTDSYRSVAAAAGSPRAVRAAGNALATNPIPIIVPCHRVLRSDGELGGYRGGPERKHALLRHEASGRGPGAQRFKGIL